MASFDTQLTSITQDSFAPKAVDTVLGGNLFTQLMLANSKSFEGETMKFPVQVALAANGGAYFGADTHNTNKVDTLNKLAFDVRAYVQPVVISNIEADVNNTSAGIIKLVGYEMERASNEMSDGVGTAFYSDGTGTTNKQFLGLAAAVDDGSSVATYGGLNRNSITYDSVEVLSSTVTASGGSLTLSAIRTLINNVSGGSKRPNIALCNETVWSLYEQLLAPTLNHQIMTRTISPTARLLGSTAPAGSGITGDGGFVGLDFGGVPFYADEKATAQTLFMLNTNFLAWYGLRSSSEDQAISISAASIDGVYEDFPVKGFFWSGFQKSYNQDMKAGFLRLKGNLICNNSRRQGKLTGVTTV